MGGVTSAPKTKIKSDQTVVIDVPCPRPPVHAGKFLLQSTSNTGTCVDGGGGVYLSCNADGILCSATTENDPELWRLQYQNGSSIATDKHEYFYLQNTGRKRLIVAESDGKCSSVLCTEDGSANSNTNLFFLLHASSNTPTQSYFIKNVKYGTFLSHSNDGIVSLITTENSNSNNAKWNLTPSF